MTTPEIIALVELGLEAGKAITEVVQAAIKQPEPPTLEELHQRILDTIASRKKPWLATARQAADTAEAAAAEAAFKGVRSVPEP